MVKDMIGLVWLNKGNGQKILTIRKDWDLEAGEHVRVTKLGVEKEVPIIVDPKTTEKPVDILNNKKEEDMEMPKMDMDLGEDRFLDLTAAPQEEGKVEEAEEEFESAQSLLDLDLDF